MTKKMTFEEFKATRKFYPDLLKSEEPDLHDYCEGFNPNRTHPALVYDGFYVIEFTTNQWDINCQAEGMYYMLLYNEQYITNDLDKLEAILYVEFIPDENN